MEQDERRINQEQWMSDEVRVLVGTIAFGLGINKAAVRAVIHLSLPKSIEQYYQEAGRAGRDGAPADCVLLWQKRDAGLLAHFVEQIVDPAEKQRAWQRYHEIRGFVESKSCRHLQICRHFGETPAWKTCDACDICGSEPDWLSEPVAERRASRRKLKPILSNADRSARDRAEMSSDVDPDLRAYLREWRMETAKQQKVPAFVVLHDTTLNEICRLRPNSLRGLLEITGIGERKAALYGEKILEALRQFRTGARAAHG
jgi:ATP-dependent DNA helicase RecQ